MLSQPVPAAITSDTELTGKGNNGVCVVTGELDVHGVTLTVDPGVTVALQFNGSTPGSLRVETGENNKAGALVAKGTPAAPIVFTTAGSPQAGDCLHPPTSTTWGGISLQPGTKADLAPWRP